ncbi:mannosyltransferase [Arcticibacter svalbardensis MN12-7]|uniref:Mannosyltransferase n=1 Tax=Arcticibacter svalbardensis MN12-7 TaxID=1150600 RepID=R9GMK2_9SPHI|nr:glycosyltransferase family 1 protein [Arcticibacter svalbardensis]EOR92958.1 mannosyltransferase [Arcticibacter svalbardensis MN12-7]
MRIGFDGKRAANNLTGLGNYSRSLIVQLAKLFPDNQYFVYAPKQKKSKQIDTFLNTDGIELKLPNKNSLSLIWRSFGIKSQLKKDNIVLYHGLSNEIPFGIQSTGIKSIVSIHDLIFLRYPNYYKAIDRFIYNFKTRYAAKNCDCIVAISQKTKQDLIEFYNIKEEKIKVIYQSCDEAFKQNQSQEFKDSIKAKYTLPDKYVLNVGTIEPRKNLLLLINALKDIDPTCKLVVVGRNQPYADQVRAQIKSLNLSDRVIFLKDLPFIDLPAIYQMASVFVYPSFYEGFGIPVIEALYSGIPVVAAKGSCLEEAGGPESVYIDPNDSSALAKALNGILSDSILQNKMKIAGLKYVQKFDSDLLAQQMIACYYAQLNKK